MKMHGVKIEGPNEVILPIPRASGDIIFIAKGITDMAPFFALCPEPKPPQIMLAGGVRKPDFDDEKYKAKCQKWIQQQSDWMAITSLKDTPGLEWETVNYSDPNTWGNYQDELRAAGFSNGEINRILMCAIEANGLDETKISEARRRFLAMREEERNPSSSQTAEANCTPSGTPAAE